MFVSEPIAITKASGTLAAGTYAVVYDECQDGKVDAVDSVFDPAFRVELLHTDLESLVATVAAEPSADTSGPQAEAGGPCTGSVGAPLVLDSFGG